MGLGDKQLHCEDLTQTLSSIECGDRSNTVLFCKFRAGRVLMVLMTGPFVAEYLPQACHHLPIKRPPGVYYSSKARDVRQE